MAFTVTVSVVAEPRPAQFASGVNLVEVYATVTDPNGQVVTGLTADDFQVSEDGRPQTITTFAAGEFPLAVAIALDRSFSMTPERLGMAKSAARAFISALRPADQGDGCDRQRDGDRGAALDRSRPRPRRARSPGPVGHDAALRRDAGRDRRDSTGTGPARADPAVRRHRSLQPDERDRAHRSGAAQRRARVSGRDRPIEDARPRRARGRDGRSYVCCSRRAAGRSHAGHHRARAAVPVFAGVLPAGAARG